MNISHLPFISYTLGLLTVLIDMSSVTLFGYYLVQATLCYFLVQLVFAPRLPLIIFCCLLVGIISFLQYGTFGIDYTYLIPLSVVTLEIRHKLRSPYYLPAILLILCLILQTLVVEHYFLQYALSMDFTVRKVFVNLIVIIGMSLIFYPKGNLGDRL